GLRKLPRAAPRARAGLRRVPSHRRHPRGARATRRCAPGLHGVPRRSRRRATGTDPLILPGMSRAVRGPLRAARVHRLPFPGDTGGNAGAADREWNAVSRRRRWAHGRLAPARGVAVLLGLALSGATPGHAQSWRMRLDARAQMASFRGVDLDSLHSSAVVTGPTGGPVTPDGQIVRCPPTTTYCYFFRPGEPRRG